MTVPGSQMPEVDPLATFTKRPAVSFDPSRGGHPMGEFAVLKVTGYADVVPRRDPKTKEILIYPDSGRPKLSMVIPVEEQVGSEWVEKNLWGKKPGGLVAALAAAQAQLQEQVGDSNRRIRPGDTLAVRWSANGEKTDNDPLTSHPKIFEVKIKPGVAPPPSGNTDPFESAAAGGATQPQQTTAAVPPPSPAAPQPRPQVGGDPFATPVTDAAAAAQGPRGTAPVADDPFGANPGADEPPF